MADYFNKTSCKRFVHLQHYHLFLKNSFTDYIINKRTKEQQQNDEFGRHSAMKCINVYPGGSGYRMERLPAIATVIEELAWNAGSKIDKI